MADRPRFFDDLAGVAGGAFSALAGMREEVEGTIRARVDEAIRRLDLVKREDLEAVQEMAARARAGQEAAEARIAALEAAVARYREPVAEAMAKPMAETMAEVGASTPVPPADPAIGGMQGAPGSSPPATTDAGTPFEPPSVS